MSTAMSTKRTFLSDRSLARAQSQTKASASAVTLPLYALVAGVVAMILGAQIGVDIVMIAGFFVATCGGLALNALFWSGYYAKHGMPNISIRSNYLD